MTQAKRLSQQAPGLTMRPGTCPVRQQRVSRSLFEDRNPREKLPIRSGYVECRECGMIYLSPAPVWDQLSKFYDWLYCTGPGEVKRDVLPGDRPGWLGPIIKSLRRLRFPTGAWHWLRRLPGSALGDVGSSESKRGIIVLPRTEEDVCGARAGSRVLSRWSATGSAMRVRVWQEDCGCPL